jgi:hypothetical protein
VRCEADSEGMSVPPGGCSAALSRLFAERLRKGGEMGCVPSRKCSFSPSYCTGVGFIPEGAGVGCSAAKEPKNATN